MTPEAVQSAYEAWGFNCGPAAVCAILNMTPEQIRPHLGDFEEKRYTSPSMMARILKSLGVDFVREPDTRFPRRGLVRVQFSGPWTKPGVPMVARYKHTHWIAVDEDRVFDVNAMSVGGWIDPWEWESSLVPYILENCVPNNDGKFWLTHCWGIYGV